MELDWSKVKKIGRVLECRPLTVEDIMARAGVSQRTAYRWVEALEDAGCAVARVRCPGGGFAFRITGAPEGFLEAET